MHNEREKKKRRRVGEGRWWGGRGEERDSQEWDAEKRHQRSCQ